GAMRGKAGACVRTTKTERIRVSVEVAAGLKTSWRGYCDCESSLRLPDRSGASKARLSVQKASNWVISTKEVLFDSLYSTIHGTFAWGVLERSRAFLGSMPVAKERPIPTRTS